LQVRLLDALTEAVGIPHQRGQTVIEIPKNLKGDKKAFLELVAFLRNMVDILNPNYGVKSGTGVGESGLYHTGSSNNGAV
jgi:hypothetical protein